MYLTEVTHCRTCLLSAPIHYRDRSITVCLATRLNTPGSVLQLPTKLPNHQTNLILEPDEELPEPPKWCPLRNMPIVISYGEGSSDKIGIKSLWPDDIGKEPEE